MTKHYPDVEANPNFAQLEEQVQKFWESDNTFEKSVNARDPKNAYVFYDGPPFANGLPHYGHLLTGYVKDAIARYQTMNGKRVERRFGWDCHGLPAEMGAEKELNISGRAAIQQFGIDKFNAHCRTSVMKYTADWEYYVNRQGRWVDFKNDYKTMDTPFMESCLWAFKELYNKGLIYESMRVMPYSWAAETPVSNFETRIDNATREREDKAAYVKFKLASVPDFIAEKWPNLQDCYVVAWTTTPWTLPSNLALAVGNLAYEAVKVSDSECRIYSATAAAKFHPEIFSSAFSRTGKSEEIAEEQSEEHHFVHWKKLLGLSYEPLFPFFKDTKNAFKVLDGGDAVTEGEGTGVVHMAPGFGEVDQQICAKNGIEVMVPVDEKGKFTSEIFDLDDLKLRGLVVVPDTRIAEADIVVSEEDKAQHIAAKDVAKYGLANMRIVRWLKAHNALVKDEPYKHNYPHCWRTDTPLIYRAMSSWYVNVQKIKANMAENNKNIHWIPDHVREGQMGKGIESAPDWSISRNRFWGTPIPIWESASGKIHVCGSIEEIEKLSGKKVPDLHRPFIDEVVLKIDGEDYTRIEDVFDCWFESGSMPYAQVHYPFENKEQFEKTFPADFITEYIAQTRGWFYTLQVLSAALFGCAPFKNVICHGVVIDEETGLKYSKRLKNYKDPKEVMDQYGADALRWMMLASPVMRGADLGVDPDGKFIRDIVRLNIKPIWNAYNFFTLYANADGIQAKDITSAKDVLDRYILAKAKAAVIQVKASLDAYDTPGACEAITGFFEVLNNWYIRRSKDRFWAEEVNDDKQAAYDTLFTALNIMCKAAAPLLPFTAEAIYRGLNGEASSVHLQDFPDVSKIADDAEVITLMDGVRDICTSALAIRNKLNIRVRQPLASLTFAGNAKYMAAVETAKGSGVWGTLSGVIQDEVNVKNYATGGSFEDYATIKLQINSAVLGKRLPEKMKQILPASKKGEWNRTSDGGVEIAGEKLLPTEYNIQLEPKPEYKDNAQAISTNDGIVILDTKVSPELEAEGLARDMVRMIQQARKDAGLHVSDRIALTLELPAGFKAALNHRDMIAEQTLAVSLNEGNASASEKTSTQEVDGEKVVIGISKAA
ncbi:MAG: isoleucine--tRNA ligase [Alphaproteobacteria bacterium]|nr:isoleucine--tRNA ligase [Alphaproteobacteria bacterium]